MLSGPVFTDQADADEWCDESQFASKEAGEWQVFALTRADDAVAHRSGWTGPRPTRAFLLPVSGDALEYWIAPVRSDVPARVGYGFGHTRSAMDVIVAGSCTFVRRCSWSGRHGDYRLMADGRTPTKQPTDGDVNRLLRNHVKGIDGNLRGPVFIARMKRTHEDADRDEDAACEDNADPRSCFLSIPAHIKPADWKQLLNAADAHTYMDAQVTADGRVLE